MILAHVAGPVSAIKTSSIADPVNTPLSTMPDGSGISNVINRICVLMAISGLAGLGGEKTHTLPLSSQPANNSQRDVLRAVENPNELLTSSAPG
jgi:hypothetical protein